MRFVFSLLFLLTSYQQGISGSLVSLPKYLNSLAPNFEGTPFAASQPVRYQQMYSSNDFAVFEHTGMWLTQIAYRLRFPDSILSGLSEHMEFFLSISHSPPEGLAQNLDRNVGIRQTQVWGPAVRKFDETQEPFQTNALTRFSFDFDFDVPFFYDPQEGNLLVEIHTRDSVNLTMGRIVADSSCEIDSSSRAASFLAHPNDPVLFDSCALVTRFKFASFAPMLIRGTTTFTKDGQLRMQMTGVRDHVVTLERSVDFINWQSVATNYVETPPFTITDSNPDPKGGFYRIAVPEKSP